MGLTKMRIVSKSPERTLEIGEALGLLLEKGAVVALVGRLGSGKTLLTQGLARGLGVGPDEYVSSPSFALVNRYAGRVPIYHIDTYRLGDDVEMVALGYEEYFEPDGVTIIEWADKVEKLLPEKCLRIEIAIVDRTTRELNVEPVGAWPEAISTEIERVLSELNLPDQ